MNTITTQVLMEMGSECDRAVANYGEFRSAHEAYAVLLEEVEEVWEEVKNNKKPGAYLRMRSELIQAGAMAVKFVRMLDDIADRERI